MKISNDMDLRQLWERMDANGDLEFSESQAKKMRDQLVEDAGSYGWSDTSDVEDVDWFRMLDAAIKADV